MTARVCGLDVSLTCTGWAAPDGSYGVLRPRVHDGKWRELRGAERLSWLRDEVLALEHEHRVELFAIEGFAFGVKSSRSHEIGGAGWIVRVALWDAGIPWIDVPPSSLKKYATSNGSAKKPDMQAAAYKRLGYQPDKPDDNEIDALWLRAMILDKLGCPTVDVPQSHRVALDKIVLDEREDAA